MIRTRFAPSPTGHLHIGSLRTALFDYLFAKKNHGVFVLRIEDTDRERLVPGAAEKIIATLDEFGLHPDEGPGKADGNFGPYIQSERLGIYKKYSEQLIDKQAAYYCFCSTQQLEESKKRQQAQGLPPRYDGACRGLGEEEIKAKLTSGMPHVIRHKMPRTGLTEYDDLVYGHLQFKNDLLDDSILVKSDGYPVYNFANVVDDHLMEITHVIRGEEFLSSTPKHVQLYRAFDWGLPAFAHLPLILDRERKKLSKRFGDMSVEEYLNKGYFKEALLNFIALLGWNPKSTREIFSLDELAAEFSLEKVNKSGAVFDTTKLDYLNRQWRKRLGLRPAEDPLFKRAHALLSEKLGSVDQKTLEAIWPQVLERIQGPSAAEEIGEFTFYFQTPAYEAGLLIWKNTARETIKKNLELLKEFLADLKPEEFEQEQLEHKTKAFLQEQGIGLGEALWPLRVALSGQKNSPGPFEIMEVFGKQLERPKEIFARIDTAIKKLG